MKYTFIIFLTLLVRCTPIPQSASGYGSGGKILTTNDQVYEPQVKTVTLHPLYNDPAATLLPSVTKLGEWNLVLQFDDLQSEKNNYYLKLIHCNYDWSKSNLQDLDFMNDFNEFPVNNFEYSVDTHVPYIHYSIALPAVKLPGNYVAMIYRDSNKEDVILTKRFMIYDSQVSIGGEQNLVGAGSIARLNQQINFTINYQNLDIINPLQNVKVVIRQNQRWDNLASDLKPSFVREIEKQLEYRFFDDEKMFKGGNEFRFFDLRSLNNPGRNVDYVVKTTRPYDVFLAKDKSREHEAYAQYNDQNGGFVIDNYDYRDNTFSNYVNVNFILSAPSNVNGNIYVTGALNQWNLNGDNLMYYDSSKNVYRASMLLKQGWYDYQYIIKSQNKPSYYLEGSHYETENSYEIFVYYQPFKPQADLLIGYVRLAKNER